MLLVESSRASGQSVRDAITDPAMMDDCELLPVATVAEAQVIMAHQPIDVVVLDIGDSDVHGVSGVGDLRAAGQAIPIIVVNGPASAEAARAYAEAGARDYLSSADAGPSSLRRAVIYATGRRRQDRIEDNRRSLANDRGMSSAGRATSVTAQLAGHGSIRERKPAAFGTLVEQYLSLFHEYLDPPADPHIRPLSTMERIATSIGDEGGGPRDLLDLHVVALERAIGGTTVERTSTLVFEGRLLAIEMMGLLVDYYRLGHRRRIAPGDRA
ncbi:response regulator [Bradyrhizobium sp. ORS 375]|uniref:response regulator n=1 Tax=Bradyrhizobium sp. (strain ORS 375) TaxID=566679 RepID=UPI001FCB2E89|nr:response regulator [Bradyrhizobium sp. ORS 375]